jgi:hypothetical protein
VRERSSWNTLKLPAFLEEVVQRAKQIRFAFVPNDRLPRAHQPQVGNRVRPYERPDQNILVDAERQDDCARWSNARTASSKAPP